MRRRRRFPWLLVAVWASWLCALQAWCASSPALAPWVPELGLVLFLALGERIERSQGVALAVLLGCVRIGFSTDPPLAILAVYAGIAGAYGVLGDAFALERAPARAFFAAAGALALAGFATFARSLTLPDASSLVPVQQLAWRGALMTSVFALFLAPLFARLPGLSPLWSRRP